jgi:hypothetical protein
VIWQHDRHEHESTEESASELVRDNRISD